ncbi:MAG: sigma-70 family RNA polymerase sigma factor [Planctomycetota bacterium]
METANLSTLTDTPESALGSSQSLVARAKLNDTDAWNRMVQLYSPLVYYWCKESGLSEADVHDVFQDVFHSVAQNLKQYRPIHGSSFRGWLRTVTRNKLNDFFRKYQRLEQPIGGTEALQYFGQIVAHEETTSSSVESKSSNPSPDELKIQHTLLCKALDNIRPHFTDQTWHAFWMVVIDGRETKDVADELSMRPGTVRVAKSRVLKRLRLEIGDDADEML